MILIQFQLLHLLTLVILALTLTISNVSADGDFSALVMLISKDTNTSLYSITLNNHDLNKSQQEQYVMDLGGSILWLNCSEQFPTSDDCPSYFCYIAQLYRSPLCPVVTNPCPCTVSTVNPITETCVLSKLGNKYLSIFVTNGHNPLYTLTFFERSVSCAPPSLFSSLPVGSSGMAGFSRFTDFALPRMFSPYFFGFKNQLAFCLPDTPINPGVAFLGNGPFYFKPPTGTTEVDVTSILSNTPLLKHPTKIDYYIDLKGIYIGGEPCPFPSQMLEFDSLGYGGVKLSTVVPYTTLRSAIYFNLLKQFDKATRGMPRARKVKPFDLCLETNITSLGSQVPQIDLNLANGVNWTISGSNSMKLVSSDVACFAFVDGGNKLEEAIVLGSYQMENNFLLFDLKQSNLGFSSSLLNAGIRCSDFNVTALGSSI